MSLLGRRSFVFLLAAVLIPAFSAGEARAQCQGGSQRGQMNARSANSTLRTGRQGNNLTAGLQSGATLQTNLTQQQNSLQTALAQTTALLNGAQQQGLSQAQINQLVTLRQQLAVLLAASQQQAVLSQQ
jgi:hypothetical protein